jgi:hypothetical protein
MTPMTPQMQTLSKGGNGSTRRSIHDYCPLLRGLIINRRLLAVCGNAPRTHAHMHTHIHTQHTHTHTPSRRRLFCIHPGNAPFVSSPRRPYLHTGTFGLGFLATTEHGVGLIMSLFTMATSSLLYSIYNGTMRHLRARSIACIPSLAFLLLGSNSCSGVHRQTLFVSCSQLVALTCSKFCRKSRKCPKNARKQTICLTPP